MSEDIIYLISCFLPNALILAYMYFKLWLKRSTLLMHLLAIVIYSLYFAYQMHYNGNGGSSLLWLVALMVCIAIHTLINLLLMIIRGRR
jgi:hypothetical protein